MGHLGLGDEVGPGEQEEHSGNWELLNKDMKVKMEGKQYVRQPTVFQELVIV